MYLYVYCKLFINLYKCVPKYQSRGKYNLTLSSIDGIKNVALNNIWRDYNTSE